MADSARARWAGYLERSLELLERDSPVHYDVVQERLGELVTVVYIDDLAPLSVRLGGEARISDESQGDIEVRLRGSDLDALLRGELSVEEAIDANRLECRAPVDQLIALFDALRGFLHGALRCPSLAELHESYLREPRRAWHPAVPTTTPRHPSTKELTP